MMQLLREQLGDISRRFDSIEPDLWRPPLWDRCTGAVKPPPGQRAGGHRLQAPARLFVCPRWPVECRAGLGKLREASPVWRFRAGKVLSSPGMPLRADIQV